MSLTPEQIALAVPMAARGIPYQVISDRLGVARSWLYDQLNRGGHITQRRAHGERVDVATYYSVPYMPDGTEAVEIPQEVAASRPVHWLERGPGQCKWPIGDGMHLKSCCAQVRRRSPYCEEHHEISILDKAA